MKMLLFLLFMSFLLISNNASSINIKNKTISINNKIQEISSKLNSNYNFTEDIEPFGDLEITVTIKEIRAYDKIDIISEPDFYIRLIINGEIYKSKIWHNQRYVNEEWSKTVNIPDDLENVSITISINVI